MACLQMRRGAGLGGRGGLQQRVRGVRLVWWTTGVGLATANEDAPKSERQQTPGSFPPMWVFLITLFAVGLGMLAAEQLLYRDVSAKAVSRPVGTVTASAPAAEPAASSSNSEVSDFEMIDESG